MEEKDIQMNMSLYDLNRSVVFNLPPQDKHVIDKHFMNINSGFYKYENPGFMLMCKERSDFTIIHIKDNHYPQAVKELKEILQERGIISSLQYIEDQDAGEIGVKTDEEAFMFMLFEASGMIVEV